MTQVDPASVFLTEAQELLAQLEESLLALEDAPQDRDLIDTVFRALHTLKGSGGMFGFTDMADFTHHVENAFDLVRQGKLEVSLDLISNALGSRDHIRALICEPAATTPGRGQALLDELAALTEAEGSTHLVTAVADDTADDGETPGEPVAWMVTFRLPPDCMMRGTNPLLLLRELADLGETEVEGLTDALPPLANLDPTALHIGWKVKLTTTAQRAAIEDVFIFVADEAELKIETLEATKPAKTETPKKQVAADAPPAKVAAAPTDAAPVAAPNNTAATLRVPAERLDRLLDQVGELVIAQARLSRLVESDGGAEMKAVAEEIERLSASLRDTTMGIRMLPIGTLFSRFKRLVRDLSQELGKEIIMTMSGEETELDKTVIERLNDPLVHIIRNSLDHGVEPGDAREAAGKTRQGRVHLTAIHSGAEVLITIRDDGRGLDADRIRAKAAESGLIAPDAPLTEGELFQLIFHPGFSTAATITNVSGRGVGMDVVKRTIDQLRGVIEVSSEAGKGTAVTLRLPLTLAIIEGLLVRVGSGTYVIPLSAVEECVELTANDARIDRSCSFLNLRGTLVPYLELRDLFAVTAEEPPFPKIVIIGNGEERVGLVVDQLIGNHQIVIKSMSKLHSDVVTFSGATILGDGTVALILDVPHLVSFAQVKEERARAS